MAFAALCVGGLTLAADEIHWTITGPTSVMFDWRGPASDNVIAYGLGAGNYTTIVRGVNNTTGIAVSEAYKLNN